MPELCHDQERLAAVWVPDERHEAMRELARARDVAQKDLRMKRQQISGFLLRHGLHYRGKKTWGKAHLNWLASQKLDHVEQRFAFEELLLGMRQALERSERIEQAILDALPDWSLAPNVTALQAMGASIRSPRSDSSPRSEIPPASNTRAS